MNKKDKIKGHILALFTVCVWATTFIASKKLLVYYTPVQVMTVRFALAYVMLWIIRPKWEKPKLRDEITYFFMGVTGCTLYFFTENTSLLYTSASNVSIIVAAAPIFTAIAAHLFVNGEKLTKWIWIGFAVAFSGVMLVVFNGAFILKLSPAGDLLALCAALTWAVYSTLQIRMLASHGVFLVTRKVMFYGLLTSLPLFAIESDSFSFAPLANPMLVFCIMFLGILGSGLCYVAWASAQKRIGAVRTGNYIYIVPFVTMIFSSFFLPDEKITVSGIVGAVLIILGVILSSKGKNNMLKIDRREGGYAVCFDENGKQTDIPKEKIEGEFSDGDTLVAVENGYRVEKKDNTEMRSRFDNLFGKKNT